GKASFVEAVKSPLAAVIASPHFLYLPEPAGDPPSESGSIPLDGWQVAARLSYFLWSSMPDEELSALAESGGLAEPSVLESQADRLLADPRAFALSANFAGQWLGLHQVGANPPVET